MCQWNKANRQKRSAPLYPNEIPSTPWEIMSMDLIGPLPESQGHDAILVLVDHFSKTMHAVPTSITLTSEGVSQILRDHIFRLYGLPRKIISDRGTNFMSKFIEDLYQKLGIQANRSTAYHPQTDGQME